MHDGVSAATYHERTKHVPDQQWDRPDPENRPRDHKRYVDVPAQALGDRIQSTPVATLAALGGDPPAPDDPASKTDVDLEALTQRCYYAAGVLQEVDRGDSRFHFRAASCTGALYHVDLYPVVGDDGPVPAGVYHFDPLTCSLDVLRKGDYRGVLAAASGDHERVADAPVTFVTTSTWWRNAWKYTERTFRHAFWDSGTVLANLLSVATALEIPASVVLGFADDQVANLLGVETAEEAPLELVPVGAGSPIGTESRPDVDPLDYETEPLSPNPNSFPLIHEAYQGGSLPDGGAARAWRDDPVSAPLSAGRDERDSGGERILLDPVGAGRGSKAPLPVAIRRRRSCREYSEAPLNFRKFSTILDRAVRHQPLDCLAGDAPLLLNDCYLAVNAVEGLEPGRYQYHPTDGELELLQAGDCRDDVTRLALDQDWGGDAAVAVYFMTDVDGVVERLGERGYRAAQLEASLIGGRLYLACYAHRDVAGLGLTFFDDMVTDFFSPRAAGQTPTFHYVFGTPDSA
jgi:SagB-type dehydrogenase family enzyme